jgi:hypothetical protein
MNRNYVLFLVFICIVASFSKVSSAQWVQTNGPEGGTVGCIAGNGSDLYIGAEGNVYHSTNKGATWTA